MRKIGKVKFLKELLIFEVQQAHPHVYNFGKSTLWEQPFWIRSVKNPLLVCQEEEEEEKEGGGGGGGEGEEEEEKEEKKEEKKKK